MVPYRQDILPDYKLTVENFYRDLMMCIIRNSSTPLLFPHISGRKGLAPSWIPDLGDPDLPELDFYSSHCSGFSKHEIVYLEDKESLRIPGVHVGVVSEIGVTIPKTAKIPQALELCRLWEPKNLLDEKYVDGTPLWHAFMSTLVCGMTVEDSSTAHSRETLDLEALLDGYLRCVKLGMTNQYTDKICRWLACSLPGRSCFTMTDGRFGLCLPSLQVGDYVCVGLGCKRALTLHPLAGKHNSLQLRGECYLHGFNQSEALLGSLVRIPSTRNPWTARWRWSFDGGYTYDIVVYTDGFIKT